jgi:hypothetical protein
LGPKKKFNISFYEVKNDDDDDDLFGLFKSLQKKTFYRVRVFLLQKNPTEIMNPESENFQFF